MARSVYDRIPRAGKPFLVGPVPRRVLRQARRPVRPSVETAAGRRPPGNTLKQRQASSHVADMPL